MFLLIPGRASVAAMFLTNGLIMGAWAPQIPLLLPRHGIGESVLGLLILGLGLGAIATMHVAGRLCSTWGADRTLRLFAALSLPMLPLVILAPDLWLLAPAMVAFGAAVGCMDVAMNACAVAVERASGRAIMSSSHGFWSLGGFVGGSMGGLLITAAGPLGQALLVAATGALLAGLAARRLPADPPQPADSPAPRHGMLPRDPAIWAVGGLALLCILPEGAIMDWGALYLLKQLGSDTATSGLGFAAFSACMAVMRFSGDALRNRFGAVRTLRLSTLIAALALAGAALAPNAPLAISAFALAGLGLANTVPILFSAGGNHPGLSPGAGLSTVTMIGYSGILVAPSAIGLVAEQAGYRLTYAALAALLLIVSAAAPMARAADGAQSRP